MTVPLKAYREVPVEPLRGKVVIDTNNYYPDRDGHLAELDDESTTTSELLQAPPGRRPCGQGVQQHLRRSPAILARPAGADRSALAIAGDDEAAKQTVVTSSSTAIGYDAFDVGPLAEGWRFQRDTAAYVPPYAIARHDVPDWPRVRDSPTCCGTRSRQPSATATCDPR